MHTKELEAKINNLYYCRYQDEICMNNLDCDNCTHEKEADLSRLEVD